MRESWGQEAVNKATEAELMPDSGKGREEALLGWGGAVLERAGGWDGPPRGRRLGPRALTDPEHQPGEGLREEHSQQRDSKCKGPVVGGEFGMSRGQIIGQ